MCRSETKEPRPRDAQKKATAGVSKRASRSFPCLYHQLSPQANLTPTDLTLKASKKQKIDDVLLRGQHRAAYLQPFLPRRLGKEQEVHSLHAGERQLCQGQELALCAYCQRENPLSVRLQGRQMRGVRRRQPSGTGAPLGAAPEGDCAVVVREEEAQEAAGASAIGCQQGGQAAEAGRGVQGRHQRRPEGVSVDLLLARPCDRWKTDEMAPRITDISFKRIIKIGFKDFLLSLSHPPSFGEPLSRAQCHRKITGWKAARVLSTAVLIGSSLISLISRLPSAQYN